MGINYFFYNEKSSLEYNVFISGEHTWDTPSKDIDVFEVPGKNGTLSISNGRYKNINITYRCFIADNFSANFDAFKAYLLSQTGYKKLKDTYHPEYYRRARYVEGIYPEMTQLNRHGGFDIVFDCDPRRFLTEGEELKEVTSGTVILNDTLFTASPIIRAYGTGTITVGSVSVVVNSADGYTDLDCELQEAYKGSTNCNANITLSNGVFPTLKPGNNTITFSGFSKVEIASNFWTI